jgi:hypothetical protein
MVTFQDHFRHANLDCLSTATTGLAPPGYHGTVNHVKNASTPVPTTNTTNNAAINAQIIAYTLPTQVALALTGMSITPPNTNTGNQCPKSYCWTHGITMNLCHNSKTCNH